MKITAPPAIAKRPGVSPVKSATHIGFSTGSKAEIKPASRAGVLLIPVVKKM
jgi:hypothetical protein